MTDHSAPDGGTEAPTVSCSRCGREWDLDREVSEVPPGGHAIEQFALDHERHTGHYPDDVRPWTVRCRRCPDGERFLAEGPARRWAETHARHTRHTVDVEAPTGDDVVVTADDE